MSTIDLPVVVGHRGRGWTSFLRSMGSVLDLTGAANRRNLDALRQRRDWETLESDLQRVIGDYRSVATEIASSENDDARRAIEIAIRQEYQAAWIDSIRHVLEEAETVSRRQHLEPQDTTTLRLCKALRAASLLAEPEVTMSDREHARDGIV